MKRIIITVFFLTLIFPIIYSSPIELSDSFKIQQEFQVNNGKGTIELTINDRFDIRPNFIDLLPTKEDITQDMLKEELTDSIVSPIIKLYEKIIDNTEFDISSMNEVAKLLKNLDHQDIAHEAIQILNRVKNHLGNSQNALENISTNDQYDLKIKLNIIGLIYYETILLALPKIMQLINAAKCNINSHIECSYLINLFNWKALNYCQEVCSNSFKSRYYENSNKFEELLYTPEGIVIALTTLIVINYYIFNNLNRKHHSQNKIKIQSAKKLNNFIDNINLLFENFNNLLVIKDLKEISLEKVEAIQKVCKNLELNNLNNKIKLLLK